MTLPTPQRWTDRAWRDAALEWAMRALDRHGLALRAWTQPHVRPWSTVLRLETDSGAFWLKGCGDGTRSEVALLDTLARLDVPHTPRPLAVDGPLGLALLPDGGQTCRAHHGGRSPLAVREQILVTGALAQRATESRTADLLACGLDDLSPARMPARLTETVDLLAGSGRLGADDAARLRALLPAYAEACAELAGSAIRPTLQHDDLHDGNVLHAGLVVIDWGDAVVAHPFGTLLSSLSSVAHHLELALDDPALLRLADAYTEVWSDVADLATRRRHVLLALRVGPLSRTLAWLRALQGSDEASHEEWGAHPALWLVEIAGDDLPLRPAPWGAGAA